MAPAVLPKAKGVKRYRAIAAMERQAAGLLIVLLIVLIIRHTQFVGLQDLMAQHVSPESCQCGWPVSLEITTMEISY